MTTATASTTNATSALNAMLAGQSGTSSGASSAATSAAEQGDRFLKLLVTQLHRLLRRVARHLEQLCLLTLDLGQLFVVGREVALARAHLVFRIAGQLDLQLAVTTIAI